MEKSVFLLQTCNVFACLPLWDWEFSCLLSSRTRRSGKLRTDIENSHFLRLDMKIIQRRQWHPTPVLLPGKSHGRRSLVGCSPWGHEESDTTERLHFHALEKEMAIHSSVLAWRIPGTAEPGGLTSVGSHRVRHDWSDAAAAAWKLSLEFCGNPAVKTMHFHCRGAGSIPGWGTKIPQATWHEVKWKSLSCVRLFATPWAMQSTEFSRPEYWSG